MFDFSFSCNEKLQPLQEEAAKMSGAAAFWYGGGWSLVVVVGVILLIGLGCWWKKWKKNKK